MNYYKEARRIANILDLDISQQIIEFLIKGQTRKTESEIVKSLNLLQTTANQALNKLVEYRILNKEHEGTQRFYTVNHTDYEIIRTMLYDVVDFVKGIDNEIDQAIAAHAASKN